MIDFRASFCEFNSVLSGVSVLAKPYPLLRDDNGSERIYCVSPLHGRSFVIGKSICNRWIVSKGNGLSYSTIPFLDTSKVNGDMWGALFKENAIRDFEIGQEIRELGIKTNYMEYVLELNRTFIMPMQQTEAASYLLQYTVECPYRISDFPFMPTEAFKEEVKKWKKENGGFFSQYHLIAANTLIRNLRIMHDNDIMHNAIHIQNYTWALELVDFEGSRTNKLPYDNKEYEKYVPLLKEGEVIQTYEVLNYIAWCLKEKINYAQIDNLFRDYGFDLSFYQVSFRKANC